MVEINEIKIELLCSECGDDLTVETQYEQGNATILKIAPCEGCLRDSTIRFNDIND